jgi:hypothetical protein
MSIKFISKLNRGFGYGYKVVRKIDEETYTPYFEYFLRGGGGGTVVPENPTPDFLKRIVKTKITYRFYEKARLRHRRLARTSIPPEQIYLAGFHLWRDADYAHERLLALQAFNPELNLVLIKCSWSLPVAADDETVVVKSFTPLEELKPQEEEIHGEEKEESSKE